MRRLGLKLSNWSIVPSSLGFGFKKIDGTDKFVYPLQRNPHEYEVIIGDNVEVSETAAICKGSWRNTVIGNGSKIDNFVHVAHNVIIGKHTWIAAHATVCGSAEIGDYCEIGAGSKIAPHIKIGNHCTVQMGANVCEDMPNDSIAKTVQAEIKRKVRYIGW